MKSPSDSGSSTSSLPAPPARCRSSASGMVERAIKARRHRPIFMVDLAVPRDIESEVGELDDVFLYTVDDLAQVVESGLESRQAAVVEAEAIITTRRNLPRLAGDARRGAGHPLAARRCRTGAPARDGACDEAPGQGRKPRRSVLDQLSLRLTNKFLHAPTQALNSAEADERESLQITPPLAPFSPARRRVASSCTNHLQRAAAEGPQRRAQRFLEIRAGTGGDESALFAGDLFRMYTRYAERQRWQVEIVSASESDLGGYKEVIARIVGNGAYRGSSSSPAATACSACRKPRRRAASTPRPAPSR
jgi:hypothetical protein